MFDPSPLLRVGEEKMELSNKKLGSADVNLVAAWLKRPEVSAVVTSMTLESTGDMSDQKTYTLTGGEAAIDIGGKKLGSADMNLISAWISHKLIQAVHAGELEKAKNLLAVEDIDPK